MNTKPILPVKSLWRAIGLFGIAGIFLVSLLVPIGQTQTANAARASSATGCYDWTIQTIIAGKDFDTRDRSLRVDNAGHPHIAYGYHFLYYAWHDGTSWHYETVDTTPGTGMQATLALDSNNNPHITYVRYYNDVKEIRYAHKTQSGWSIETVTSLDIGLWWPAIALDSTNAPHIVYQRDGLAPDRGLGYAHKVGGNWVNQLIESTNVSEGTTVGLTPEIAIDSNDHIHVAYTALYSNAEQLRYAYWDGSIWNLQTIEQGGGTGRAPSIAIGSDNQPQIAYWQEWTEDLKYARWNGNAWDIQTIDSSGRTGRGPSLALDSANNPHISYWNQSNNRAQYAAWSGSFWDIMSADTNAAAGQTSLALDAAGDPHLLYIDGNSNILYYNYWDGAQFVRSQVDQMMNSAWAVSLALDGTNHPHLAYPISHELAYAYWDGMQWNIQTVDNGTSIGIPSIAIDTSNFPAIAYEKDGILRVHKSITSRVSSALAVNAGQSCNSIADKFHVLANSRWSWFRRIL